MPVDRPTFSESWYRVADLKPRLRSTLQVHRQRYRGHLWYVVQDPSANQFFRLNTAAYRFLSLLNGKRSVAEVWNICNEQLGDEAPTQGEVIQLLGQLYVSNLLMAEIPPDAQSLFERYRKRKQREVQGYLTNLLFIRFPLFDPDRILNAFLPAVAWIFSWIGAVIWAGIVGTGLYFVIQNWGRLAGRAQGILDTDNLPLLYLSFALIKAFHEFGHGFACKKFGRAEGTGGEVHVMGIMLLVFTPMPYVDASSAWALRNKWHRVIVGAGGMLVELAIASIMIIVWSHTASGTIINAISYNVMFIASVSTLLFNGNPLLRYDGYYILSDILEIPNMSQRGKNYIYYIVRKYLWGVKRARNPAHTGGERFWLLFYGIASTIYRVFICAGILMFVSQKFFLLGMTLAAGAIFAWVAIPLGKFFRYLLTNNELSRTRGRAIASTVAFFVLLIGGLGFIPAEDHMRVDGVVEPTDLAYVYAGENGFLVGYLPSGKQVVKKKSILLNTENPELQTRIESLQAKIKELKIERRIALRPPKEDLARAQMLREQLSAVREQLDRAVERADRLDVAAPANGLWVAPGIDRLEGSYVEQGKTIGMIASPQDFRIRALAKQDIAATIFNELEGGRRKESVQVRVQGRPDLEFSGVIEVALPTGKRELPSEVFAQQAGGSIQIDPEEKGMATEHLFEIRVLPDDESDVRLLAGQRVVVRIPLDKKPLVRQWFQKLRRLFQKRFKM